MKTNNAVLPALFVLWSVALLLLANSQGQSTGISPADAAVKKTATAPSAGKIVRNSIGMQLVYVPAGSFMMGSTDADVQEVYAQAQRDVGTAAKLEWFTREQPRHQVTLRSPFYLGRYEVTQAQWQTVMGSNPSQFRGCELCPVEQISWNDAQEFIRKLNAMNDGFTYSLPSEAQWEYACRAGKTTEFSFGSSISSAQANFDGQYPFGGAAKGVSREKTMPVGSFPPNAWDFMTCMATCGSFAAISGMTTTTAHRRMVRNGRVAGIQRIGSNAAGPGTFTPTPCAAPIVSARGRTCGSITMVCG